VACSPIGGRGLKTGARLARTLLPAVREVYDRLLGRTEERRRVEQSGSVDIVVKSAFDVGTPAGAVTDDSPVATDQEPETAQLPELSTRTSALRGQVARRTRPALGDALRYGLWRSAAGTDGQQL
jgi:hypothetical protein